MLPSTTEVQNYTKHPVNRENKQPLSDKGKACQLANR